MAIFEHAGQARIALLSIVSDPACGPAALSDASALSNLLSDLLPDAPRETGVLVAAAQARLAEQMREHVDKGMDAATAIPLAASSLATRTAYSEGACAWAAGELAVALGLTTVDELPVLTPPEHQTAIAPANVAPALGTVTRSAPTGADGPGMTERVRDGGKVPSRGPRRVRVMSLVAVLAVLAVASSVAALVTLRQPPKRDVAESVPAPRLAAFVPASQQVLRVYPVHLDSSPIPQMVVTTTGQPSANSPIPAEDLLLLRWDDLARRWTLVYDAAKVPVDAAYEPDAYLSSYEDSAAPHSEPMLASHDGVSKLRVMEV
jgi:hypothetical protein